MTREAPPRAATYHRLALDAVPRLLGTLDRDPWSATTGSFDRDHWSWKFRDFPLTMLQTGMLPLAHLWASDRPENPYRQSPRLLRWLVDAMHETLRRQHRSGAFDSVAPNTMDHGVTLAMVYTLATVARYLDASLPPDLVRRLGPAVRLACRFAARSDEDYAFISNHHALFALAWLRAADLLGEPELLQRADGEIGQIIAHQSADGWYAEYGGPDPGYESLGINYLAQYDAERPGEQLRSSMHRAVAFLSHCVHPDGTVGGLYGSRGTSLWYPAGMEHLAQHDPVARAVACHVASFLDQSQVVTTATSDPENLALLVHSYLMAADLVAAQDGTPIENSDGAADSLPCKTLRGVRLFEGSGITVAGTPQYYAVLNGNRGGTGMVHARATARLVHQDSGYFLESNDGVWTSAMHLGTVRPGGNGGRTVMVLARFARANRAVLTPGRFIVLRLLNLTVFRVGALGRLVRRAVIGRLVTRRTPGPYLLEREVRFGEDRITFVDRLRTGQRRDVTRLSRTDRSLAMHMGSGNYFHMRDLADTSGMELPATARELSRRGEVVHMVDLTFAPDGGVTCVERDEAETVAPVSPGIDA